MPELATLAYPGLPYAVITLRLDHGQPVLHLKVLISQTTCVCVCLCICVCACVCVRLCVNEYYACVDSGSCHVRKSSCLQTKQTLNLSRRTVWVFITVVRLHMIKALMLAIAL